MRKRLLIVFSVLLFLLCLSVVSATDENTNSSIVAQDYGGNEFYVDLGGDDSNSGQLNSPFNSINKAVEVSKSNDNVVIHLGEGTYSGTSANLDIYYSTFEDNVVTDRGGAIFSYSYVGIYDSTFIRNKGTGTSSTGGSIYINGNSNKYSVLNRNIFKDTSVARQGGAIYLSYGNVTNCIFENASTTATGSSYGGGAIMGLVLTLKTIL